MTYEEQIKLNIKNNIIALRKKCGLTQQETAEALTIKDASTYRSWETGRSSPKPAMLLKIAQIYGISVEDLMGVEAPTPVPNRLKVASPSTYNENIYGDRYMGELQNDEKLFVMKLRQLNLQDKAKVAEFLENILPR